MSDTLLSFVLGTLFGVCLTLLVIHLNNKRKLPRKAKVAEAPATIAAAPVSKEVQTAAHEELPTLAQHTENFENNGNGRATLTGFEVHEEEPGALDFVREEAASPALEEITAIDEIALRDQFLEYEWIEAERLEAQKVEAELIETARLEALQPNAEALEANRIEIDRAEAERVEADRIEAERIEAERAEAKRIEAEHIEADRIEAERIEAERVETERIEAERVETERIEAERVEAERVETERIEAERIEAERVEAERVEAERLETENLEREFAALQAAQAAAEEAAKEVARQDLELAAKRAAETSARIAAEHAAERAAELAAELATEQAAEQERQRLHQEHARAEAQARETAQQLAAQQAAIVPPEKISKTPAEILIMVADDSKVVRVKTSRVLAKHDYQVALAEDGNDAASQIDLIMPDLLITDVEMPGMDGFALTLHLRANPATAHLPIIMISGASDELAGKAKQAGIDVLLGKPYSDEDLIGHIRRLVQVQG